MCLRRGDQTERRPQRWHILAPRRRKIQRLRLRTSNNCVPDPLHCLFNDKESLNAWSKLAYSAPPPPKTDVRRSPRNSKKRTSTLSKLESLPSELLATIIGDSTLAKSDVIALGLASETLWAHVLQAVEKDCSPAQPVLAGVEIACIGTYLLDLPEPFLKDGLAKSSVEFRTGGIICEARNINWAARSIYDEVEETPEEAWRAAWEVHDGLATWFPAKQARKMGVEFLARCSALRGSRLDAPWALRNLTTREYVRCKPGEGRVEGRGIVDCGRARFKLRVDDVLLLRIGWTRTGHEEDWRWLGICRGQWAGHCFDIVPWERLDGEGEWRDCTDEVVAQATVVAEKILPATVTPSP